MNPITTAAAAVLIAAVAAGAGYGKGYFAGKATVQQAWDRQVAEQQAEYAKAQEEARAKEQAMQAAADKLRQEKDREIRDLNARATALANSVQQRPDRATQGGTVSGTAGSGQARSRCTGAELPREDAAFLAREAARADSLRASLNQCLAQYEALKH
jgi:hypothetical protein